MWKLFLNVLLLTMSTSMFAISESPAEIVADTTFMGIKLNQRSSSWQDYNPERGYFQKAFSDKGDPRFMISNEDDSFEFGIGGTLRMTAFGDFNGSTDHDRFSVWTVEVPTYKKSHVGINVATSKLFFKSRAKIGKQKLISYLEINTNEENVIKLGKAYVSYGGLTAGKTYSFFMDLAAGVQTVDLRGVNTSVDKTHPLVGYSFGTKHWDFGIAAEQPDYSVSLFKDLNMRDDYQPIPDLAAKVSYKGKFGHIQVSGLLRSLSYWSLDNVNYKPLSDKNQLEDVTIDGSSRHKIAYGVSVSGRINFSDKCFTSFQGVYGKGIHSYINDLGDTNLDMIPEYEYTYGGAICRMKPLPVIGGYIGLQYNWSKKLSSSLVFGDVYTDIDNFDVISWNKSLDSYWSDTKTIDTKNMSYFALNLFYNVNNFLTVGAEFLNGMRWQQNRVGPVYDEKTDIYYGVTEGGKTRGSANRFNLMFSYSF